jgi:hypothetical protein
MKYRGVFVLAAVAAAISMGGCGARQALDNIGFAATRSTAPPQATPAAPATAAPAPYELSATAHGPVVFFTLKNKGTVPLDVRREDFAMIIPGSNRRVIPFSDNIGTLDLKQGPLQPNETLQGRVIFQDINAPGGNRLVYKPDQTGTFARIETPSAKS